MKIEGLKKTVNFVCNELKDTQKKVQAINARLKEKEGMVKRLKARSEELEIYVRRWNLHLYGVDEDPKENVREKVVKLCQKILPETTERPGAAVAVDVAHHLGVCTMLLNQELSWCGFL
ncbi:hypothetical protein GOODEAATRI_024036 [Goodea atripinnis]|uniref:Uncharacterized protein n=1 Tax=Goodea atripinnis TaxID=208336 RepID=A0ABV0ND51_9TELE